MPHDPRDDFRIPCPSDRPAVWDEWFPADDEMDGYEAELLARIGRGETLRLEAA